MAPGDTTPGASETPTLIFVALFTALQELRGTSQAPPGDRYRLQLPNFGEGAVEQFIREFEDVASIAEWPARVRILQLRACLTGRAKSFTLGPDGAHPVGPQDPVWPDGGGGFKSPTGHEEGSKDVSGRPHECGGTSGSDCFQSRHRR